MTTSSRGSAPTIEALLDEAGPGARADYEQHRSDLVANGYTDVPDGAHDRLRVGARVRHRGQRWPEALDHGTATAVAVMERASSSWSQRYGTRDIEVIVLRDDTSHGFATGVWASYGTDLAREQTATTQTATGATP